jgi:hypothetical protein
MFSTLFYAVLHIYTAHTSAYNSYTSYGLFRKGYVVKIMDGVLTTRINNVNCVVGFNIKQIPVFVYKHTFAVYNNFALVARNYR